jgi:hypothetical protein
MSQPETERERLKRIRDHNKTVLYGDLNDPTPRETLNMRDLDLDTSYVGKIEIRPGPERPPRLMRWQHPPGEPLIDYAQLPQGWSMHDDDLDPEYGFVLASSILKNSRFPKYLNG